MKNIESCPKVLALIALAPPTALYKSALRNQVATTNIQVSGK